jgi:hypothetical protein
MSQPRFYLSFIKLFYSKNGSFFTKIESFWWKVWQESRKINEKGARECEFTK